MNQDQITRNFMIINTTMARMQKQIDIGMDKRIRALEAKVDELTAQAEPNAYEVAGTMDDLKIIIVDRMEPSVAGKEAKRGPGRPRKDAEAA